MAERTWLASFAETAPRAVQLQLRLRNVRPIFSANGVWQRLKRKEDRGSRINRALSACLIRQEPRLPDFRLAQIGLCLLRVGLRFQLCSICRFILPAVDGARVRLRQKQSFVASTTVAEIR